MNKETCKAPFMVSRFASMYLQEAIAWQQKKNSIAFNADQHAAVVTSFDVFEAGDDQERQVDMKPGTLICASVPKKNVVYAERTKNDGDAPIEPSFSIIVPPKEKLHVATFIWFDNKQTMFQYLEEWRESDKNFVAYVDDNPLVREIERDNGFEADTEQLIR